MPPLPGEREWEAWARGRGSSDSAQSSHYWRSQSESVGRDVPGRACKAPSSVLSPGSELRDGVWVVVHGLKTRPELNSKRGRCEQHDKKPGRWLVRLEDLEVLSFRPDNLQVELQWDVRAGRWITQKGEAFRAQNIDTATALPDNRGWRGRTANSWIFNEQESQSEHSATLISTCLGVACDMT